MKLCLVNICLRPDYSVRYLPVGMAYVATALKNAGVEFDMIDMDVNTMSFDELAKLLERGSYDAVGMGTIVTGLRTVKTIAEIVKKINPETIVFAGNSVASSITELLLRNTEVDIAVISEADHTVVELFDALVGKKQLSDVAGVAFLHDDKLFRTPPRPTIRPLDSVGYPDWDIFDIDKYSRFLRTNSYGTDQANDFGTSENDVYAFPVNTARGCPYSCTFCYHEFIGKKYRRYTDQMIGDQIRLLHDKYKCNYVCLWDEISFLNTKTVRSFLDMLNGLEFNIGWEAPVRTDLFKKEDLPLIRDMADTGCGSLVFSLESADEEILLAMKKKITVKDFIDQAHVIQKAGIEPKTGVIFGYPQESEKSIERTIELCYQSNMFPSVGFLLPMPGTPIYEWARKTGKIENELEYLLSIGDRQDFSINLTEMSDQHLQDVVNENLEKLAARQKIKMPSFLKTTRPPTPQASRDEIQRNKTSVLEQAIA